MTIPRSSIDLEAYGSSVEFRVLGPVQVLQGGATLALGGPKQRTVLALLIASAGTPVSIGSLIHGLYGDEATPGSKRTIHTYVSNLRAQIGDAITRSGDGYVFAADSIDAVEFERLYREGRDLIDVDPARSATVFRESLALWHGHPYADVEDRGLLSAEISRLEELRLAALEARIDADLAVGRHNDLVGELEALTEEFPLRERLRGLHMLALYRSGRQSEALRAFGRTRTVLAEELGIDPSPELRDLEEAILTQDAKLEIRVKARIERRAIIAAELDLAFSGVAERDEALDRRDAILSSVASDGGGALVDVRGSAAIAAFPSVSSAFAAVSRLASEPFRMAIDVGDVEVGDDTMVGPPLVRALRLAAAANPGQALLSPEAHADLSAGTTSGWASRSLGPHRISGIDADLVIHQLLLDGHPTTFPPLAVDRLPPPLPELTAPAAVAGYELREELGTGASGTVHRAYQRALGREVAVRTIRRDLVGDARFIRRFEAVAQRVAATDHPHLAPMIDYWREPDTACMVSRLFVGGDLRTRMRFGLSSHDARAVLDHVGSALATAHDNGLAHGRVRPENVLFDDAGQPYLSDLGLAGILYDLVAFEPDAYTAPERIMGVPAVPGDIYSLGVLAAELLSGSTLPADRGLPSLGASLDRVIARATHPDPDQRHRSVVHFLDDLAAAAPSEPTTPADRTEVRNPYKGLAAFKEADAGDFFGRSQLVDELIGAVSTNRLTLVVGPSGIGKSSAVRAGLMPAVRRGAIEGSETWLVTDMFPGSRPFDALGEALERVAVSSPIAAVEGLRSGSARLHEIVRDLVPLGTRLLLVVDQFEELFTHVTDEETRLRFLDALAAVETDVNRTVRVVATMRADFYDRPLEYSSFGELVSPRTVAVPAPSREDLEEIIRGPAASVGLPMTDGLVDALIDDADREPGALPLLQHALTEIFEEREVNLLDVGQYRESGGLAGSIGRRGEHIYLGFSPDDRQYIRELFLRLVTVDEDAEDTRRRVRRSELEAMAAPPGLLDRVLEAFGRHRLLVFDRDTATRGPTVEVAHEALIREWDRLQGWIDEARDDLLMRRRVEIATRDWLEAGNDQSYLLSGGRLERAEAWRDESAMDVGAGEREFLVESRRALDREQAVRARIRRRVLVGLSTALVLALGLGAIAWRQSLMAQRSAVEARVQELVTQAEVAIGEDPDLAILLAVEAYSMHADSDIPALDGAVSRALQLTTQASRIEARLPEGLLTVAVSPDQRWLALDSPTDRMEVVVYDLSTLDERARFRAGGPVGALAFSPDGSRLVVGFGDLSGEFELADFGAGELYDAGSFELIASLGGPCCSAFMAFNETGEYLLSEQSGEGFYVGLWSMSDVAHMDRLDALIADWSDEKELVMATDDGRVSWAQAPRWDSTAGFNVDGLAPYSMAAAPSGGPIAIYSRQAAETIVVDRVGGELFRRATTGGLRVEFNNDGSKLLIVGNNDAVEVVDMASMDVLSMAGVGSGAGIGAFAGSRVIVPDLGVGGTVVFDVSPTGPAALGNLDAGLDPIQIFRSGGSLLTIGMNGKYAAASIIDEASTETRLMPAIDRRYGWDVWRWPVISRGGRMAGLLDSAGRAVVVDLGAGLAVRTFAQCETVKAISSDSDRAVVDGRFTCASQGTNRIVSLNDTNVPDVELGSVGVHAASFGPRGTLSEGLVAVGYDNARVELVDWSNGGVLGTFDPPDFASLSVEFSDDGTSLGLGDFGGNVYVVDVGAVLDGATMNEAVALGVEGGLGPSNAVYASGNRAMSFHGGQTVRFWDLVTKGLLFELPIDTSNLARGYIDPDATFAYYEDGGGILRRILFNVDQQAELARSRATRTLTVDECERFLYDTDCSVYEE